MKVETCRYVCDCQECCDCCSLGLHVRSEGHRCDAHRLMGFRCQRVFLTCCSGKEGATGSGYDWHSVREIPPLAPTRPPQKGTHKYYAPKNLMKEGCFFFVVFLWAVWRYITLQGKRTDLEPKTINFLYTTCSEDTLQ